MFLFMDTSAVKVLIHLIKAIGMPLEGRGWNHYFSRGCIAEKVKKSLIDDTEAVSVVRTGMPAEQRYCA
jgi:hypothetical protein